MRTRQHVFTFIKGLFDSSDLVLGIRLELLLGVRVSVLHLVVMVRVWS